MWWGCKKVISIHVHTCIMHGVGLCSGGGGGCIIRIHILHGWLAGVRLGPRERNRARVGGGGGAAALVDAAAAVSMYVSKYLGYSLKVNK